jgi:outer membrane protein OmpA-like peptidoglycan-associated protein
MKRYFVVIYSLLIILTVSSENTGFSRWSFAPEYGYNKFDGDIYTHSIQVVPGSLEHMTYGATLEYGITPVWGFSLDYFHLPLTANNNSKTININTDLNTSDLNTTLNFTRLFFPQSKSKIYINGGLGLGYASYTFISTPPSLGINLKNGTAYSIPITLSIEYNLSKSIGFGTKVQYRAFNKDDLEGVSSLNFKGNSNDFVGSGTFFIRYKFNSTKKEHLRNVKMDVFSPDNALEQSKLNAQKLTDLDHVITKLEGIVNYQNRIIDSMNVYLAKIGSTLNGVGIQDLREADLTDPQRRSTKSKSKPLMKKGDSFQTRESVEEIPAIYFDFNNTELDDKALVAISKIANKLKSDPSLYVEVRGYCDNLDNEKQNNLLSQRRSDRVKSELVNYWKIPYNHIITDTKGDVAEHISTSRPNRRCDIFFVKL